MIITVSVLLSGYEDSAADQDPDNSGAVWNRRLEHLS